MEASRRTCFDNAIKVATIFGAYCEKFHIRTMFVTGMQHAATAATAIVEGMNEDNSRKRAENLLHLQCLAEALHAHSGSYLTAKWMSKKLFNVVGEYRKNHLGFEQRQRQEELAGYTGAESQTLQPQRDLDMIEAGQFRMGYKSPQVNGLQEGNHEAYLASSTIDCQSGTERGTDSTHIFSPDDEIWASIMQTLSQEPHFDTWLEHLQA